MKHLYKTAVVKNDVVVENGVILAGTVVSVSYIGEYKNRLYRAIDDLYQTDKGTISSRNLHKFCL